MPRLGLDHLAEDNRIEHSCETFRQSGIDPAQGEPQRTNDAKRLKELEVENARLKRLLADAELDKAMLKELAEGNF